MASKYSNPKQIATNGCMVFSCTIRCGEQHTRSYRQLLDKLFVEILFVGLIFEADKDSQDGRQ